MKIMVDAHNLGLKQPTGIGVYARNLASSLNEMDHEVSALYSMRYGSSKFPYNTSFYQKLSIEGEASSSGILRWAYHSIPYSSSFLFGVSCRPKLVKSSFELHNKGLNKKLPLGTTPYNLPYVYRVSQAFAALSGRPIIINSPKKLDLDVLHLTLPLPISIRGAKKVVTIHDLIPLKVPISTVVNLKHYVKIIKTSIKDADLVFAVSEKTKSDLIEIFNFPESKIHVTYQSSFIPKNIMNVSTDAMTPVLDQYNLVHKKYFIYYGAIEPKKNVLRLLQAFTKARTDCKLVVLGKNGWLFEEEEKFFENQRYSQRYNQRYDQRYDPKIVRIPYSDFTEIMTLLKGARALIFPSLYEGFGLPVLEAMQMGTPVITSPNGSLPEVAGDAAHYVDAYSVEDIKSAIEKFTGNDEILTQMTSNGHTQAQKFSTENYKRNLFSGYAKLF